MAKNPPLPHDASGIFHERECLSSAQKNGMLLSEFDVRAANLALSIVAQSYNLTAINIINGGRRRPRPEARMLFVHIMQKKTDLPVKDIAAFLGGMCHSTFSKNQDSKTFGDAIRTKGPSLLKEFSLGGGAKKTQKEILLIEQVLVFAKVRNPSKVAHAFLRRCA